MSGAMLLLSSHGPAAGGFTTASLTGVLILKGSADVLWAAPFPCPSTANVSPKTAVLVCNHS